MLAFIGYLATDAGLRLPGDKFAAVGASISAHDQAVANGSMGYIDPMFVGFTHPFPRFLLLIVSVLELSNGAAIYDAAMGSGRKPGEFNFDPLKFGAKKDYGENEIQNGRAAMLAMGGILTQQALGYPLIAF